MKVHTRLTVGRSSELDGRERRRIGGRVGTDQLENLVIYEDVKIVPSVDVRGQVRSSGAATQTIAGRRKCPTLRASVDMKTLAIRTQQDLGLTQPNLTAFVHIFCVGKLWQLAGNGDDHVVDGCRIPG